MSMTLYGGSIQSSSFNEQHLHKTMLYQVAQFQNQYLNGPFSLPIMLSLATLVQPMECVFRAGSV